MSTAASARGWKCTLVSAMDDSASAALTMCNTAANSAMCGSGATSTDCNAAQIASRMKEQPQSGVTSRCGWYPGEKWTAR